MTLWSAWRGEERSQSQRPVRHREVQTDGQCRRGSEQDEAEGEQHPGGREKERRRMKGSAR